MNSKEAIPKPIERSWPTGPWIQTHRPKWDVSVKYVCDKCLLPAITGVLMSKSGLDKGKWLCVSCERGKTRKGRRARSGTQNLKSGSGIVREYGHGGRMCKTHAPLSR